jgi:hypothetical protein
MTELKDRNQNPWYILMTLFGEQVEERFDHTLSAENRHAWNSWVLTGVSDDEEREKLKRLAGWEEGKIESWQFEVTDIETLYRNEMRARNGAEFDIPRLPAPTAEIDCTRLEFQNALNIDGFIFPKAADFFESHFLARLHGRKAVFGQICKFQKCEFKAPVVFSDAQFLGITEFFQSFCRNGFFATTARFEKFANFAEVDFYGMTEFSEISFEGVVHFRDATFHGRGEVSSHRIDFSDTTFEKPVNFRRTVFMQRYPRFSGTVFHDNSIFSPEEEYWPSVTVAEPVEAKEFCARARILMSRQGFSEEEHQFFRREMAFAGRLGGWERRLPYRLFGFLSNYGESIQRPVLGLVGLVTVFWLVFLSNFAWNAIRYDGARTGFEALALSLSNSFSFFGFQRLYFGSDYIEALPIWIKAASATQTVLAFILLFFLGLGLRTRFRLR